MYNQGNMRLHVDIFIKYVTNNVYSDNNHGQPQSILNIFLTFLVAYTLRQPFVAYFRSDIYIIVFFCGAGWKRVGRRDCLTKKIKNFTSSGAQRWADREMGNTKHQKKYGHPYKGRTKQVHLYIISISLYSMSLLSINFVKH